MTKILDKYPNQNPGQARRKREKDTPQSTELPQIRKKVRSTPTKKRPGETFKDIGDGTQAGHTPRPSEKRNNQTGIGTDRDSRGGRNINSTRKKKN